MEEPQIPIFAKAYDLYKLLGSWRGGIPKQDRHALWQRAEERMLVIIEGLLRASQQSVGQKPAMLETVSVDLNVLRVFLRLAKDTRAIDLKKYAQAQMQIDEIGRMLGGWLRSLRSGRKPPPQRNILMKKKKKEVPERRNTRVRVGIVVPVVDVKTLGITPHVDKVAVSRPNMYLTPCWSLRIELCSLRCIASGSSRASANTSARAKHGLPSFSICS